VVLFISFILAIAIPSFLRAANLSRSRACQENLQKLDGSKQQWAIETNANGTSSPEWSDLVGFTLFLRKTPACPENGDYTLNSIAEDPACSLSSKEEHPHILVGDTTLSGS
jgi:general secretion pathway protein G